MVWAIGRATEKHGWMAHLGLDLLRAQIVTQSITYGLKYWYNVIGPMAPGAIHSRRGTPRRRSPRLPCSSATSDGSSASRLTSGLVYVGASRLHENRHYLSDVVFGATVGIIAGRTVTRHGRDNYALVPLAVPGGLGIAFTRITN